MVIINFLASLKPKFEPVRAQTLGGADLPLIDETYARVLHTSSNNSSSHTMAIGERSTLLTKSCESH